MIFITDETDLDLKGTVALYFYADWLLFHKKMLVMIEKMELKHDHIKFFGIDVDSFKNLSKSRFNVTSIPTTIIIGNDGKEIKRVVGMPLISAFRKFFNDIYKSHGENNGKKE